MKRTCKKCGEEKNIDDFLSDKNCRYGKTHTCKECAKIRRVELAGSKAKYDMERYKRTKKALAKLREENPELYKLRSYKAYDKKRGLETTIDIDFCKSEMRKPCFYCYHVDEACNGLDRIDNSKGHTIENCIPCCTLCNMTRGDRWSHDDFLLFVAPGIIKYRSKNDGRY